MERYAYSPATATPAFEPAGTSISSVERLQDQGARITPLVIGAGPPEKEFRKLAGCILTGHLSGTGLARAIASADILLNPNATETFGNVIVESMASGLPVISAAAQNSRSILTEGKNGFLCTSEDVDAYAAAIETLINDDALRLTMGSSARRASLLYSWDATSQAVDDVYQSLVQ